MDKLEIKLLKIRNCHPTNKHPKKPFFLANLLSSNSPHLIAFTETHLLSDSSDAFSFLFPNYSSFNTPSTGSSGGLMFLYHKTIDLPTQIPFPSSSFLALNFPNLQHSISQADWIQTQLTFDRSTSSVFLIKIPLNKPTWFSASRPISKIFPKFFSLFK